MGSVVGGLLGGGDDGGSSTSTSRVEVPSWLDDRNQSLAGRAENLSKRAFTPYEDQRIANFTADANRAFDLTRNNVGRFDDLLSTASSSVYDLTSRANGPTTGQIQERMNPFLDNVLNISKRNTIEDYNTLQAERDREAGLINAFGGSRVAIRQAEADEQLMEDLRDLDYQGRFDAYDVARNQFNTDTNVLSNSITQGLNTAGQGQQISQSEINELLKQGELQRLREQDQLDFNFQEFDREQAFDYEQVNFLANILNPLTGAYAGGETTSTTDDSSGSDTLGNIAGLASSAASIAGIFSDERVKENIKEVGKLDNGLSVYSYNYKGSPQTQIGLIAQEVEGTKPEAVGDVGGIKTVDYDKAVELRDGGPVSSNRASAARLAGVASAGSPRFPGVITPQLPGNVQPDFDADGFRAILEDLGIDTGQAEDVVWDTDRIDGTIPDVTDVATPPINPNLGGTGLLDFLGFADGGPVGPISQKREDARNFLTSIFGQQEVSPERSRGANLLTRVNNAAQALPVGLTDMAFAPLDAVESGGEALAATVNDFLFTPESEVALRREGDLKEAAFRGKQQLAEAKEEASDSQDLAQLIAAKREGLRGRTITGSDLQVGGVTLPNMPPVSTDVPADMAELTNVTPDAVPPRGSFAPRNNSQSLELPEWITPTNPQTQSETPKEDKKGINVPLLLAGITMLATDGDSGDKILQGINVGTKFAGDRARQQQALAIQAQEQRRQQFRDYIDFMRAQAYAEAARGNANRGNGLTPYQRESLALDKRKLDLKEKELNNELGLNLDGSNPEQLDPFQNLDIKAIEKSLRDFSK